VVCRFNEEKKVRLLPLRVSKEVRGILFVCV
jgi:hypothetical protein